MDCEPKTLIGVLASHDSVTKNEALKKVFDSAVKTAEGRRALSEFRFVFTGGTYLRLFEGWPAAGQLKGAAVNHKLERETKGFLLDCGIVCLPPTEEGGVTILSRPYLTENGKHSLDFFHLSLLTCSFPTISPCSVWPTNGG